MASQRKSVASSRASGQTVEQVDELVEHVYILTLNKRKNSAAVDTAQILNMLGFEDLSFFSFLHSLS